MVKDEATGQVREGMTWEACGGCPPVINTNANKNTVIKEIKYSYTICTAYLGATWVLCA